MDPITAVIEKPRTFYVINTNASSYGGPAFTLDGKLAGILVLRKLPKGATTMMSMSGNVLDVVLPAADVADVAKQAKAAK